MNTASIRADFDQIARLTDGQHSAGTRYFSYLASLVPHDATRVLDVGCGLGLLTTKLANPSRHITGVDLSPEMIARARKNSAAERLQFVCGDFLEQDFAYEQFDCVISAATLHHMPTMIAVPRMAKLIRPGGRLIVHDIRVDDGIYDQARSGFALAQEAFLRLIRTGWPRSPRAVRDAWKRHAAGEKHLTYHEAEEMASQFLPGAAVFYHWLWRYTIVWDKP